MKIMQQWKNLKGKQINILFTSVGRRVELIDQWKKSLKTCNIDGNIYGTDIDPTAPAMHTVDEGFLVSRTESDNFIHDIINICTNKSIDLIFPLIDPDIPVLSANKDRIKKTGSNLVIIEHSFVGVAQDKWLTYILFKDLGLITPKSWIPEDGINWQNMQYPLLVKPRSGSASVGVRIVHSAVELQQFLKTTVNPIIQEYIQGNEITCDVICTLKGEVVSVVLRQRIEVRSGEVSKGRTIFNKEVIDSCVKIANKIKAVGPITIQCIMKNDVPHFIEINPRYGGGAPLGFAAGVNSPEWYIKEYSSIPITYPPIGTYNHNLYMTRADKTIFLSRDDLEKFKSYNI